MQTWIVGAFGTIIISFLSYLLNSFYADNKRLREKSKEERLNREREEKENKDKEMELLKNGIKSIEFLLLKDQLQSIIQQGYIEIDVYNHYKDIYENYHDLNGNGIIEKLWKRVDELDTKDML